MPELDFVLEMAARDQPDVWEFTRGGHEKTSAPELMSAWSDVLAGDAARRLRRADGRERADKGAAAWYARQARKSIPLGLRVHGRKASDVGSADNGIGGIGASGVAAAAPGAGKPA